MTPAEALKLAGVTSLPVRVGPVLQELGYKVEANARLKRPAITWRDRQTVGFRPGGWAEMREALAHEIGHICLDHSGDGHFSAARAWASPNDVEREAHRFAEDFLMPEHLLTPWFEVGGRIALSRIVEMCQVSEGFARRRIRRAGLSAYVWDDTTPGAHRRP